MHLPAITATYLAVLALLYAALGLRVASLRRRKRAVFGDGDNAGAARRDPRPRQFCRIRADHRADGGDAGSLRLVGPDHPSADGCAAAFAVLHPIGMHASPRTLQFNLGRVAGIVITVTVLIAAALLILFGSLSLYFDTVKIGLDGAGFPA